MSIGVAGFVPERLKQARSGRGMSISELEQRTGISRQSLSAYENGRTAPTPDNLIRLADELRLPEAFFTRQPADHFSKSVPLFRARRSVGQRDKEQVQSLLEWLAEIADYAMQFVNVPPLDLPEDIASGMPSDPRKILDDQITLAAQKLRKHWRLGSAPIPHLTRLLESKGIVISLVYLDSPGIDGLSMWSQVTGGPYILLNRDPDSAVRLRLTLAHELGHLVLHRRLGHRQSYGELSKLLDDQAYLFGRAFLMPEASFLSDVYSTSLDSLLRLKAKWRVSLAAMIYHLHQLAVVPESRYRNLMMHLGRRGWRVTEPYDEEWEPEQPVLLSQALKIVVDHGLQDASRLAHDTTLDAPTLARLANLPSDFLSPASYDNVITLNFG